MYILINTIYILQDINEKIFLVYCLLFTVCCLLFTVKKCVSWMVQRCTTDTKVAGSNLAHIMLFKLTVTKKISKFPLLNLRCLKWVGEKNSI